MPSKSLLFLLTICLLLPLSPLHAAARGDDDPCDTEKIEADGYENEVVIKLIDPSDMTTLNDIVTTHNLQISDTVLASRGIYLLSVIGNGDADDLDDIIEQQWMSQLVYVEANYLGDVPEANPAASWAWGGQDPTPAATQYANQMVQLAAAHGVSRGAGVTVAVLDTGVQADHAYFDGKLIAGYDFVDDDNTPDDVADGTDTDGDGTPNEAVGHGTHVAGMIHTIAPEANIMPLRVLNGDGAGDLFLIAEAILYAAEQGADVISLSLGSVYKSEVLEEAVKVAFAEYGAIIVAAAGNANSDQPQYPAAFEDEVLAVTSIDEHSVKASSANYGCWVDIAAPGEGIYSAFPTDGFAWWSGTSMATPFVAGEAALLLTANRARNNEAVMATIMNSAESILPQNPSYSGMLGAGRPNFATALGAVPTAVTLTTLDTMLPPVHLLATALMLLIISGYLYRRSDAHHS
jgi:hypothetical protein